MTQELFFLLARQVLVSGAILGLAYLILAFSRGSAAARHRVLLAALTATLLVSAFHAVLPSWHFAPGATRPDAAPIPTEVLLPSTAGPALALFPEQSGALDFSTRLLRVGTLLWGGLVVLGLGTLASILLRHRALVRRLQAPQATSLHEFDRACRSLRIPKRPRIGVAEVPSPMAIGVLNPTIVLPLRSTAWTPPRLRAVLLHELVHIQRRDILARWVARMAWILNIVQPMAWWAIRQLEFEQECATDEGVLTHGESPAAYARQLLETSVEGHVRRAPGPVVHAAQSSDIGRRIERILGADRSPQRGSLPGRALGVLGFALILSSFEISTEVRADALDLGLAAHSLGPTVDRPAGLHFDQDGRLLGASQDGSLPLVAWMGSGWALATEGSVEFTPEGLADLGSSGYLLVEVSKGDHFEQFEARALGEGNRVCCRSEAGRRVGVADGEAWLAANLPGVVDRSPIENGRLRGSPAR